jgi:hypothetical protein
VTRDHEETTLGDALDWGFTLAVSAVAFGPFLALTAVAARLAHRRLL